jgi:hypothetical protein
MPVNEALERFLAELCKDYAMIPCDDNIEHDAIMATMMV